MARANERENLMRMIFQMEIQGDFSMTEYERFVELQADSNVTSYFMKGYRQVVSHLNDIDKMIDTYSVNWKASRLPKADLAILRLALAEIFYMEEIPISVSINEAVELAKKYGTEKSAKFINGVLGSAVRKSEKQ